MQLKAAPPAAGAGLTWNGCYAGWWGGYGWGGNSNIAIAAPAPAGIPLGSGIAGPIHVDGGLVGGDVGCQYQFGAWVIGAEGDIGAAAKHGRHSLLAPIGNPLFNASIEEDWLATARARIGYAWGNSLLYVTGGGAWARPRLVISGLGTSTSDTQSFSGWSAGGGWAYALTNNWSVKVEYIYVDLGTKTFFGGPVFNPGVGAALAMPLREQTVRFGVNYKFDWLLAGGTY
jgi:outer membrane immunogenic protein